MSAQEARAAALAALAAADAQVEAEATALAPTGTEAGDGPVERLVKSDRFMFLDSDGGYQIAVRGDTVYLTEEQATRGDELAATIDPAKTSAPPTEEPVGFAATGNIGEAVAYINAHPDETDAIRATEQAREKPRKTVLDALDAIEEKQREQADAAALDVADAGDDSDGT